MSSRAIARDRVRAAPLTLAYARSAYATSPLLEDVTSEDGDPEPVGSSWEAAIKRARVRSCQATIPREKSGEPGNLSPIYLKEARTKKDDSDGDDEGDDEMWGPRFNSSGGAAARYARPQQIDNNGDPDTESLETVKTGK